jgi:hypothetical protein
MNAYHFVNVLSGLKPVSSEAGLVAVVRVQHVVLPLICHLYKEPLPADAPPVCPVCELTPVA